ncbi:hypothetical protein OROMI_006471 [Orobanche minor]
MDLSLSEPSDGKDDHMFLESNYHVGGVGSFGHSTVHSPEEDSLNEKSRVQELRILIDKADEEIMKLEEDILMLNCQIAWDDEDWSKQCFIALSAQINHFDILIKSLKKTEIAEDLHYLVEQPEKLAPRLPDLLKPLLENYLKRKSKQVPLSVVQVGGIPLEGFLFPKSSRMLEFARRVNYSSVRAEFIEFVVGKFPLG